MSLQLKTTIYYSHLQLTFLVSKQTRLCNTCSETSLKMLFLNFKYFNKMCKNLQSSSCRYYVLISDQIMECTTNHSFIKVVKIYYVGTWNWFHLTCKIIRILKLKILAQDTQVYMEARSIAALRGIANFPLASPRGKPANIKAISLICLNH